MNGIHDMGGMHGFGTVVPEANEPVFHARWESRVFAMMWASGTHRQRARASMRSAIESLPPEVYLRSSYYEKWYEAIVATLIQAGAVTPEEVASGRAAGQAPALSPMPTGPDTTPEPASGFSAGDWVRAKNLHPTHHTRVPRYVRGKSGVILRHHGTYVCDDSVYARLSRDRQPLYTVRFEARELWGDAAHPTDCVNVELWEDHLDRA